MFRFLTASIKSVHKLYRFHFVYTPILGRSICGAYFHTNYPRGPFYWHTRTWMDYHLCSSVSPRCWPVHLFTSYQNLVSTNSETFLVRSRIQESAHEPKIYVTLITSANSSVESDQVFMTLLKIRSGKSKWLPWISRAACVKGANLIKYYDSMADEE